MDNIIFYQPASASTSQPPRWPGALTASIISGRSVASTSVRQTALQLDQLNEIWKDHMIKHRDLSDPFQNGHSSDQRCRNDTVQEQGSLTATRYSPNSDDDDDLPATAELLSGVKPNNFSASAKPNSGSLAEKVDSGTRGSSLVNSSHSTRRSTQDPPQSFNTISATVILREGGTLSEEIDWDDLVEGMTTTWRRNR